MIQANIHQAKTQLSKLIERAEAGEEVVIARNGKPSVRLMPVGAFVFASDREASDAQIAAKARGRDIVGCMKGEVRAPSGDRLAAIDREIGDELLDTAKFDVALSDTIEFIPAAAR